MSVTKIIQGLDHTEVGEGEPMITLWYGDDDCESQTGTAADAAVLAETHGLRERLVQSDGATVWTA